MGRTEPSQGLQPPAKRKGIRAKQAKSTVNKTIPALISSTPRAKKGVDGAELISNPARLSKRDTAPTAALEKIINVHTKPISIQPPSSLPPTTPSFIIRIMATDTLSAAHHLHTTRNPPPHRRNIAILNMASPLRPGGGVLNGATSQEETLCTQTTLLPSLREEFYRLPELGGVFTPDVLVFRDPAGRELPKARRWYVDVVSAGMLRFPDLDAEGEGYANVADERAVEAKMVAVMRILAMKGVERVVLGAWGCGAYGNPVGAVARAWKRVLVGGETGRSGAGEEWERLKEVVFAIKEQKVVERFAEEFGELEIERVEWENPVEASVVDVDGEKAGTEELAAKIAEMEEQILRVLNPDLKQRLESVLLRLKAELEDKTAAA